MTIKITINPSFEEIHYSGSFDVNPLRVQIIRRDPEWMKSVMEDVEQTLNRLAINMENNGDFK